MSLLTDHADAVRLVGGAMLLVIGIRALWRSRILSSSEEAKAGQAMTPAGSYVQTVGLTLTNPMTILAFIGMFAGIGISSGGAEVANAVALVIGVGLGSAAWWLFLAFVTSRIRHRLSSGTVGVINAGSSMIIIAFGVAALFSAR